MKVGKGGFINIDCQGKPIKEVMDNFYDYLTFYEGVDEEIFIDYGKPLMFYNTDKTISPIINYDFNSGKFYTDKGIYRKGKYVGYGVTFVSIDSLPFNDLANDYTLKGDSLENGVYKLNVGVLYNPRVSISSPNDSRIIIVDESLLEHCYQCSLGINNTYASQFIKIANNTFNLEKLTIVVTDSMIYITQERVK